MFSSKDIFLGKGGAGGYQISRSVRLRSSASAYFNRTLSTPTSNTTWTLSCWLKRGALSNGGIFAESTGYAGIYFASDKIRVMDNAGSVALETTAVYRDPSAWAHLVVRSNGTNIKAYWNSVEVGSYTGTITLLNAATSHFIGRYSSNYFDGYLTEINFIDGQALTPASFGYADTATGVWQPLPYTGTYGTNGFYLNFSDNSAATAAAIGKDYSGNGNNWTPNNISVTSGTTYDSMVDSPSSYGTDRGNYCVWNPNFRFSVTGAFAGTFSNGNLQVATGGNPTQFAGSMALPDGAYFEVTPSSIDVNRTYVGLFAVSRSNLVTSTTNNAYNGTYNVLYSNDGYIYVNTTSGSNIFGSFSTYTNSDVISVAYKSGKIYFAKNNVWQNSGVPASGTGYVATGWDAYGDLLPYCGYNSTFTGNFGQQPFTYTPPTGFIGVCSPNLSVPTINNGANYMAATTYIGNGSTQTITNTVNGVSFAPDFAWVKVRSTAGTDHYLADTVRGATKYLQSNTTAAEGTNNGITAFNSNGFSVGAVGDTNTNGATIVGWNWKAGGTAVTNTNGSITSTVSVNQTAGFSVVTYTGTGANATVGHGLGVAPSMIIVKDRTSGSRTVSQWPVYHASLGNTKACFLNATDAAFTDSTYFNNTSPTSTTFSLGSWGGINYSGDAFVAYCFAPISGYSAFGTYTGNGSADGPFVYTGFRPRWVLVKNYDLVSGENWYLIDSSRNTYNVASSGLFPNLTNAEGGTNVSEDFLSNGFKIRATGTPLNNSGGTYIYAAFAENPFKYARAR